MSFSAHLFVVWASGGAACHSLCVLDPAGSRVLVLCAWASPMVGGDGNFHLLHC